MELLVVCQNYYPEQFRINDICEQLVKDGHKVTVLTGLPNYPTGIIPKEYRFWKKRKENINGVDVIRSLEIGRRPGILGLSMNYISFMISSSFKALFLRNKFDLVFVYQLSPITMTIPGLIYKRLHSKPLYLYCCDIWPESMKIMIKNDSSLFFKFVKKISSWIYSKCDSITVTSKPFIDYFIREHSIPAEKISYIPQHAEDLYLNIDVNSKDEVTDFVFMGNIGIVQDIDCILDAVELIKEIPGFKVHFVGDGSYLQKSRELVRSKKIEDVVDFHGRRPLEEMSDFYKLADACLLTLKCDNLIGLTMPSKLQGYMAAGKPVIGAINGTAKEVIAESGCGVCVDAGDHVALAEIMKDFIENPDKFELCGEKGRSYFKNNFTKNIFMNSLEAELTKLLHQ